MSHRIVFAAFWLITASATIAADPLTLHAAKPGGWMCVPGELLFEEEFDPDSVSERWGFKSDFALRDGALLRTRVAPRESKRVFLKDASFGNTIIQFDFKFAGRTTDLRLVTGSGGGYNSVTQIRSDHFQINTPVDRDAGMVPSHIGESVRQPRHDQWQTMTVEYWDDEILAHLGDDEFVVGRHPIIDRTRKYFAFQFDLPGASIDNVRVWKAIGQREDWNETRKTLTAKQTDREPVKRDPVERYKIASVNLRSRLTLHDPTYRELVAKHRELQAALHASYSQAFMSHKELSKRIASRKRLMRETIPEFKQMEIAVNKAAKEEDTYVLSIKPELVKLKEDGIAKQRFTSELGQVRAALEANHDEQLASLVAETTRRQHALESRFPEAFESVDASVQRRQLARKSLNDDPEFQARNREVVEADRAVKDYEHRCSPDLARLAADAKAFATARDAQRESKATDQE